MNAVCAISQKMISLFQQGRKVAFAYHKLANRIIIRENARRGILAVNICNHHGIGAKLVWALEIMAYCSEKHLTPMFRFSYFGQGQEHEHFGAFFETKKRSIEEGDIRFAKIRNVHDLGLGKDYGKDLTLSEANRLLKGNLIIRPEIQAEVNAFINAEFRNSIVLGVHYRGTDKGEEAIKLSYARVKRNIDFYIQQYPETDRIFISSDDLNFIEYIEFAKLPRPITYRNDSYRSQDGKAIHHSGRNKSEINHDAIINCLLLSRCSALMKTASILSAWSKLFNPTLPLVMLSKPFESCNYFPERALASEVLYAPIQ